MSRTTECWSCWAVGGADSRGKPLRADDWPQWRGPTRDDVWRETGLVEKFSAPQLPLRWRTPVGSGYSGPTVADGAGLRYRSADRAAGSERVQCFDWQTGRRCGISSTIAPTPK